MIESSTDQLEPQTESADSRRVGIAGWFFWFVMFLLLYVLSIGPAAKLAVAHIIPDRVVDIIYTPLGLVYKACPPAASFFDWYLALWGFK